METEQIKRRIFSLRISSDKQFEMADRDYLTEFIISEINSDTDVIIDEIFEERNCEEYILSGDAISIQKIKKSVDESFGYHYHVAYQEVV